MRGDFSRILRPTSTPSRPTFKQGRPVVDADLNLGLAAVVREMRATAGDIFGWHGGPASTDDDDAWSFVGRYYINGMAASVAIDHEDLPENGAYFLEFVELDRNHHELPGILDPAFDPLVSSWRARVEYRVHRATVDFEDGDLEEEIPFLTLIGRHGRRIEMCPALVSSSGSGAADGSTVENQLWRVELLDVAEVREVDEMSVAELHVVWARDNASTTYAIVGDPGGDDGNPVVEVIGGNGQPCDLEPGVFVQASGRDLESRDEPSLDESLYGGALYEVVEVEPDGRTITLRLRHTPTGAPGVSLGGSYLRRWDGYESLDLAGDAHETIPLAGPGDRVADFEATFRWAEAELDGPHDDDDGEVRPHLVALVGDYWTIAVRSGHGLVEEFVPTEGPTRNVAPLATRDGEDVKPLTRKIAPLSISTE